mmetsp:Transcript_2611/g.9555  ORF Transcript_2611/g.9555 Transcript_2611/m.9555 type:complete len:237 (+) Transcript_2611:2411-3121(+)
MAPAWKLSTFLTACDGSETLSRAPASSCTIQWSSSMMSDLMRTPSPMLISSIGSSSRCGMSSGRSASLMRSKSQMRTQPSRPAVRMRRFSMSRDTTSIGAVCAGAPPLRRMGVLMRPPSHRSKRPCSVPDSTLPSGSSTYPAMSLSSSLPNLPMSPWSLRPVKVPAIFQKRMCPVPHVMSCPAKYELKETSKTSCENALERSTIASSCQFQTVSQKSGKAPTVASFVPSGLKRSAP